MINFDSLSLKVFAQENKDFFIGAKIQKVQQPNRSELIFLMRNNGESKKFYINFNPNFYHLCFMSQENEKKRNISIPKTAPMFCMLLRKYIQNSKIINVDVPLNERIFEIYFEYYDELNEKSQLCLAIELMGKYSNVILYNYDTNVIIGCAHNVSSEKSRERELSGMMPYIYPPKQNKKNLLRVSFDSFFANIDKSDIIKSVSSKYHYLTIPIVSEIFNKINPFSYEELYESLKLFLSQKNYSYNIKKDFSKYFLFHIDDGIIYKDVNSLIDDYFSFHQSFWLKENLRQKIIKNIQSRLKKLYLLKEKQEEQIKKLDKASEYKQKADILIANLYNLKSFSSKEQLYDFSGNEVIIELDTNISISDNANKYYALYKKIKASFEHANLMIQDTNSQILYFEEQLFYSENADNITLLKEIYSEICEDVVTTKDVTINVDYIDYMGFKIFVGKNKKQNDYILSKIASAEDLWFHPLNAAGSHVLIKKNNNKEIVPDEVLLKAAEISKNYSSQKNNSKTSIIYTKRKYVKKANNKIAFVTYKNEIEIIV